jgi:hypothetical protein
VLALGFRKININVCLCRFELLNFDYMRHTPDKLDIMTFCNLNILVHSIDNTPSISRS